MSDKFNDHPIEQCAAAAEKIVATTPNSRVYQKWTCRHCGSRQTMEQENSFYRSGICEECKETTIITACNYMIHIGQKL
jgi:transposase-like protein